MGFSRQCCFGALSVAGVAIERCPGLQRSDVRATKEQCRSCKKLRRRRCLCCLEVFLARLLIPWSSTRGTTGAARRYSWRDAQGCNGELLIVQRSPTAIGVMFQCFSAALVLQGHRCICHSGVLHCYGGMGSEEEDVGWGFCDQVIEKLARRMIS